MGLGMPRCVLCVRGEGDCRYRSSPLVIVPGEPTAVSATSQSPSPATEPGVHTVTHRWPWRLGEFGTMAFFAAVCFGVGYISHPRWGLAGGGVAAVLVVALLYRTKISRVTRSAATATLTGDHLAVTSDGALGRSAVNLAKVTAIGYRRFGSDECFMLSDGTQGVRLPARLVLADATLRQRFVQAWEAARDTSPTAEDLYARTL